MKVNRGYVFRLKLAPVQAGAMAHAAGVCRLVYNLALEQRRDHSRQFRRVEGKGISLASHWVLPDAAQAVEVVRQLGGMRHAG